MDEATQLLRSFKDLVAASSTWSALQATGKRQKGLEYTVRQSIGQQNTLFAITCTFNDVSCRALYELLAKVEKPVLIHCNWGADRTGLASALYLAAISKAGEEKAEGQLSLRYGHFSVPVLSQAFAMDETFESLEEWLGYFGS